MAVRAVQSAGQMVLNAKPSLSLSVGRAVQSNTATCEISMIVKYWPRGIRDIPRSWMGWSRLRAAASSAAAPETD
jgi:hypothetical protein